MHQHQQKGRHPSKQRQHDDNFDIEPALFSQPWHNNIDRYQAKHFLLLKGSDPKSEVFSKVF
jgi:hypothetical protein